MCMNSRSNRRAASGLRRIHRRRARFARQVRRWQRAGGILKSRKDRRRTDVPTREGEKGKRGETGCQAPVPPEFTGAVKRDGGLLQHEECPPKSLPVGAVKRSKFTHLRKTERLVACSRKP